MSGVRVPAPPPNTPPPRPRLRRIEPVLRRALRGACVVPPGSRLLVALSGGADSTALLLGLRSLARGLGLTLHAAHLNHGMRGASADADLAFASDLCARLGVPFTAARWDCSARMRRRGLSGQAGLRTLRREFLGRVATRTGAAAIATAHTADDQLETMLLRLLRGSALGLGGMSARRGVWIKPLLDAPRADVEADLRAIGQPWCEDASNRDPRYARSRVRHEVIPALLRALDPGAGTGASPEQRARARAGLARRAAAAAAELRGVRRLVARRSARTFARLASSRGGEIALDSRRLASYPVTIQRMVLRLLWQRPGHAGYDLTERQLNALLSLVATPRGGSRVDLPNGWRAERDRGMIVIRSGSDASREPRRVPVRGRWVRGAVRGAWVSGGVARDRLRSGDQGGEYFAADEVVGGLELRPARPDEWFTPFGGRRPGRLGEFLSKQPVPRAFRAHPIVLADAQGILWVVGVRRAARAALTDATQRALWVHTETP